MDKKIEIIIEGKRYFIPKLSKRTILEVVKAFGAEEVTNISADKFLQDLEINKGLPDAAIYLRGLREREDLSQSELAEKSRIDKTNISAYERGRKDIGEKVAKKLAKILNGKWQLLVSNSERELK